VLLHNGNIYPSVPLVYSAYMREFHESIRIVLNCIDNEKYSWKVYGDLKVFGFVTCYAVMLH
jgi:hypothetical protein